ncbi:MAG: hypothetical protein E6K53_15020 [Gammaproteobacteria bacterium]|nr:MAG: hypothetical protein E6K53_15020 [Gammaproteobacteria bacterium]
MRELMRVREWTLLPLEPGGRSLIEASAGTGKTWTISALYLRLLLDVPQGDTTPLTPRGIVVATFTDAAADELRERIRGRLLRAEQITRASPDAAHAVALGELDEAETWLIARWRDDAARREHDRTRLRLALGELDLAPIGTLHGLCARVLRDYPFESGGAFASSELIAGDELTDELADDLWRHLQQGAAPAPPFGSVKSRERLREQLKWCLMPGVKLWAPTVRELDAALNATWASRLAALAGDKTIWGGKRNIPTSLRALAAHMLDRNAPWTSDDTQEIANAVALLDERKVHADAAKFLGVAARLLRYAAAGIKHHFNCSRRRSRDFTEPNGGAGAAPCCKCRHRSSASSSVSSSPAISSLDANAPPLSNG